jgi:hypothetical protein
VPLFLLKTPKGGTLSPWEGKDSQSPPRLKA